MLTNLNDCGIEPFEFAGFHFPKFVWTLPRGSMLERLMRRKNPCTGGYYHAPKPLLKGKNPGIGFYLDSDGMPRLRWQWCDEVDGVRINHKGWNSDEFGDGEKIRGIVMRLPKGRGFLAGWSMGEKMASEVDCDIWDNEIDAAHDADRMAERAAEDQREYEAEERRRIRQEESEEAEREEQARADTLNTVIAAARKVAGWQKQADLFEAVRELDQALRNYDERTGP